MKYSSKLKKGTKNALDFELEIITTLQLTSRDKFFVVHCGSEIIAFVLSPSGASLMGRWSYEERTKNN